MARVTDPLVHRHDSVYLLRPMSRRGRRWVDVRIATDRTAWDGTIVVEHRYSARSCVAHSLMDCRCADAVHGQREPS